jgi:hypothetical protein
MPRSKTTAGWCRTSNASSGDCVRSYNQSVIYCVIPPELADDLYDKMVEYYKDNPNVTVIIDRRKGPDRRNRKGAGGDGAREQRTIRDRRRPRVPGTFPETDAPAD